MKKYSKEEIEYILTHKNEPINITAQKLKRSRSGIKLIRKRHNIIRSNYKKWTEEECRYVKSLIANHSYSEISKMTGRSIDSIKRFSRRKDFYKKKFDRKPWTKEEDRYIYNLAGKKTIAYVAKALNRSIDSIENHRRELGFKWKNGIITYKKIADILGISKNTVSRKLKEMDFYERINDPEVIQKIASIILSNNRSANRVKSSFKHLENIIDGNFELN